jgi:hypothetical protein
VHWLDSIFQRKYILYLLVDQKVLNDVKKARLSRGRFGSSTTPSPPLPFSKLDRQHTGRLRKRDKLLTGEGREGIGKESNHTTARKPGPL